MDEDRNQVGMESLESAAVSNPAYPPQPQEQTPAQQPAYPQTNAPLTGYGKTPPQHPAYTLPAYGQTAQTQQSAYGQTAQTQQPAYSQTAQTQQPAYSQTAQPQQPAYSQTAQPQQPYAQTLTPAMKLEYLRNLPPISQMEAEGCRHNQEKMWYIILILLNTIAILFVLGTVAAHLSDYGEDLQEFTETLISETLEQEEQSGNETDKERRKKEREAEKERDQYIQDFTDSIPYEVKLLFYGAFVLVVGYCSLYYMNAQVRASSVKITLRNFPEIYTLIESYAWRLGMKQVPDAYIVQQSGVLNAFSSFLFRKQYIEINSEVFEVAYREHQDLDALAFIIAHEISHIYYGHATLHYNLPIWFSMNFPLFGAIASRTREYSCDRLAQHLTNNDGLEAMFMLMVDRHLYKMVDKQDYLDHAVREGGFFLWLYNLFSSHPVMPKRILALARRQGSGELF